MAHQQVYTLLLERHVQGMMAHSQLADYYSFLGLQGFKRMHERLFKCNAKVYRKMSRFYVAEFYTLPEAGAVESINVVPGVWQGVKRTSVTSDAKRKAVRDCIGIWSDWEAGTHTLLSQAYRELLEDGDVAAAMELGREIDRQDKETRRAYSLRCKLESTDYDMGHVMEVDRMLHCKWK